VEVGLVGRWRTLAERRRDLQRLVDAFDLTVDQTRPQIDRLVAAVLQEHHPDLVAWLEATDYSLTWEDVAAAAERLSWVECEDESAAILDEVLFAAVGGVVMLARPGHP
jgi:hypothetical protein